MRRRYPTRAPFDKAYERLCCGPLTPLPDPVNAMALRGRGWSPCPEPTLVLMTPSLVYKPTAWADIGGGSQTSRRQHGGMGVGSSLRTGDFPRHPPHVRCPEGLGRTLGVSARRPDMVASTPHGLVPLRRTLLGPCHAVTNSDRGVQPRRRRDSLPRPRLLPSGDCTKVVQRQRAEGRGHFDLSSADTHRRTDLEARPTKAYPRNMDRKSDVSPVTHGTPTTAWRAIRKHSKGGTGYGAYSVAVLVFGPAFPCVLDGAPRPCRVRAKSGGTLEGLM
jgi:hypothetical protein